MLSVNRYIYRDIEELAGDKAIRYIVVDPSAASFITLIQQRGRYSVIKADNRVLDGIRTTAGLLNAGKIKIHESCTDCIREFRSYSWDERAGEDKVVKESDHAMDMMRYLVMTAMRRIGEVYDVYV